ncbi:MAG: hypothetical protein IT490_11635 [Candidatus Contendobacter sp.]|nr:hypothetical protein [Candidatus Contendobacter sp.]
MALSIGTNVQSLNAQRNLASSQNSLNTSIQRLTSGMRINSAKDDSAGSAISNRFTAQIRGLNQAVRNSNDGISLAQTAEGALQETTNLLQRMRELAVQSVNDTNTASDRSSIQAEMDQLFKEVDRIAGTTKFNGKALLDGTANNSTFQVGANAGETLSVSVGAATTKALNLNGYTALGELNSGRVESTAVAAKDVAINGFDLGAIATSAGNYAKNVADAINLKASDTGVTATTYNIVKGGTAAGGVISGVSIDVNGAGSVLVDDSANVEEFVKNVNLQVAGVTATVGSKGEVILSNETGANIAISEAAAGDAARAGLTVANNAGYVALSSNDGSAINIGYGSNTPQVPASLQALGFNATAQGSALTGKAVDANKLTTSDNIQINGIKLQVDTADSSATAKAAAINTLTAQTSVRATAQTTLTTSFDLVAMGAAGATNTGISINNTDIDLSGVTTMDSLVTAINGAGIANIEASSDAKGNLILKSNVGADITIAAPVDSTTYSTDGSTYLGTTTTATGVVTLTSDNNSAIRIDGAAADLAKLGLVNQGGSDEAIGAGLSVMSATNATNAIKRIDEALAKVDENRGNLGAFQNRLSSTISNLQNVSENLSGARGRIMDADFAAETSNMTKQNILQQAGIAMLSQSNQNSQQVLSLLR